MEIWPTENTNRNSRAMIPRRRRGAAAGEPKNDDRADEQEEHFGTGAIQ